MNESLVSRLLAEAASHPERDAIVDLRRTVTYGELARRVLGAAGRLRALGVSSGDVLALCLGAAPERAPDFAAVVYAAGYLGATVLPLYPDVPAGRKRDIATLFGARLAVSADAQDLGIECLALDAICDKLHSPARAVPPGWAPDLPFLYQFSSGTSGVPKAILFSHRQYHALAASVAEHLGWKAGDRLLAPLRAPAKPGLRYLFRTLFAGATFLNLPFPDTRQGLADTIAAFGATTAGASPWQLRRMLASPPAAAGMPQLGFLESMGAPISAAEVEALRREVTPHLHVNYSSTECGMIASLPPGDPPDGAYTIVRGVQVEIVDDAGRVLPAGATGAIRLRAPGVATRYERNEAETAKRFRDGWFYPGDAGSLDAAGRLLPRGRIDGVINFGGLKVTPEEVEAVLLQHADIADAAVAAVPDAMAGEVPVALVVARCAITPEALRAFCLARIDGLSIPAGFLFVERLPRAADGKLNRMQLAEQARSLARIGHPA